MHGTIKVNVMDYETAETLGQTEMPRNEWDLYEADADPRCDSGTGTAKAGDMLNDAAIEAMGISPDTTIYLEA